LSRSRAAPTTVAPCDARARAVSTPRPALTPVTSTRLPLRFLPLRTSSVVDFSPKGAMWFSPRVIWEQADDGGCAKARVDAAAPIDWASGAAHSRPRQHQVDVMKVWEIQNAYGIENLHEAEKPEPKPGKGQIVVAMKASSLNYRDLMTVVGMAGGFPLPLI